MILYIECPEEINTQKQKIDYCSPRIRWNVEYQNTKDFGGSAELDILKLIMVIAKIF